MTDIVPGQNPLKPAVFETLAQSYAILIQAGDIEIDSLQTIPPPTLKPRVEYLLNKE